MAYAPELEQADCPGFGSLLQVGAGVQVWCALGRAGEMLDQLPIDKVWVVWWMMRVIFVAHQTMLPIKPCIVKMILMV